MIIIKVLKYVILFLVETAAMVFSALPLLVLLGAVGVSFSVETVIFAAMVLVGVINLAIMLKFLIQDGWRWRR